MQTIQLNDKEIENFIKAEYGNDTKTLIDDFIVFIKERQTINSIKQGFDEVELYEKGKIELKSADNFISELKNDN